MCFSAIAGKNTTTTGCVILGTNDDWPGCPGQVHHVPAKSWNKEDCFISVTGTRIPQPAKTYAYTYHAAAYETGTFPISWADGMNENQVAVSMQGVYTFQNLQTDRDLLEADDLTVLVMQRGQTARQSIKMLGSLIETYGFSVSTIEGAAGVACLAIADPEEGFFFEIIPGGYWAARRVADDALECRPNCFGIDNLDFEDEKNFLYSANLKTYVEKQNLWKPGECLDFASVFGEGENINPVYGGTQNPVNQLRRWRAVNLASGEDHPLDSKIYAATVSPPIDAKWMMDLLRDTLEKTPYDLTDCKEAGVHKNPFWMETSTSIGQGGTVTASVAELRREGNAHAGGRFWIGCSNTHLSIFLPTYIASEGLPAPYTIGEMGDYDLSSAWWAFQETGQLCYRNYEEIAKKVVIPAFRQLEERFIQGCEELEATLPKHAAGQSLKAYTHDCAMEAYHLALSLAKKIKGKYLCNTILDWL